jgi:patatin-like phospholipase/acyl hydrolase
LLSDICIGTSAAPTYFHAHYFDTKDPAGKVRNFHLIDGGVAANNPVNGFDIYMNITFKIINLIKRFLINNFPYLTLVYIYDPCMLYIDFSCDW